MWSISRLRRAEPRGLGIPDRARSGGSTLGEGEHVEESMGRSINSYMRSEERSDGLHLAVLMPSAWDRLQHKGTRWRALVSRWVARLDVASVTIVDYPLF